MTELYRHIGPNTDVPAGDLGVGGREVAYLFGQYKRLTNEWTGVLTGKGLSFGGSLARTEATGYGLAYFVDEYLKSRGDSFEGKNVVVHGSGNVAIYAVQKVTQLGGKVLACSDTHGWVEDPDGIDYTVLEHIYNKKRSGHDKGVTLAMYVDEKPDAVWHEGDGRGVWQLPCDIALPCARENTLLLEAALRRENISHELHLFPHGVHGLALADLETADPMKGRVPDRHINRWQALCAEWLKEE